MSDKGDESANKYHAAVDEADNWRENWRKSGVEEFMIQRALETWRDINKSPTHWAKFESVRFSNETRCAVKWGRILSNGQKEAAIQTMVWTLYDDGRYDVSQVTHV